MVWKSEYRCNLNCEADAEEMQFHCLFAETTYEHVKLFRSTFCPFSTQDVLDSLINLDTLENINIKSKW